MQLEIRYLQDHYIDQTGNVVAISPGMQQRITVPLDIDPTTQIVTIKASLEMLQDVVALGKSRGMDIEII